MLTVTVIANDDHFVFDVTGDNGADVCNEQDASQEMRICLLQTGVTACS